MQNYINLLLPGAINTVLIFIASVVTGLFISVVFTYFLLQKKSLIKSGIQYWIKIVQGIPNLLLILFIYYGLSIGVNQLSSSFLGAHIYFDISPFFAAIVSLSLFFSAYTADIFRSSYNSIRSDEIEAAKACGYSGFKLWAKIIIPNIFYLSIGGLGNTILIALKETSLVSIIGAHELLRQADFVIAREKNPFTVYMLVAIFYLALTAMISRSLRPLSKKNLLINGDKRYDA